MILAKVLWIAWLAVMDTGTLHRRLQLTADQTAAVQDLIGRVQVLSADMLRKQFEVVNRLLPSGESQSPQYLVPRAINLLSLRPNGSFLSYLQITHITAAMRYALRSTMLYRVAKSADLSSIDENDIDEECQKFLVPRKSMSFSYCIQVHAACNKFGRKHTVPTITLLTAALYRVTNEGYQQYLFSGYRGRFGAERPRNIIEHRTALSANCNTALNTQGLRQALVAFLDQYAGHTKAVGVFDDEYAHDIQSGHSSRMAVSHYAISDQDLPLS
ncbi:hypothetical protein V1527DRAFT_492317 [Lipomyces starkeyi]